MPKVSIIIPVYNGENYLKEAIDSALAQTYENVEIIVVDDGSLDATEAVALSYGDKIKYYKKQNGGVSSALNLALTKMTGEYFSWLSHDDLYYSEKIKLQIEYLIQNDKLNSNVILYSNYMVIDENSSNLGERILDNKELTEKPEYALLRCSINGITLLIPKKAFDECGKFDEKLRCTQDYDLWLKMMKKYKFEHIPYTLAKTRVHKGQETNTNPKVITEGNPLWIKMIDSISDKRKKALDGSIYNYYYNEACFLGETPYVEALKHCVNKLNDMDKTKRLTINNFIKIQKNDSSIFEVIKKLFVSLKQLGFKKTVDKIKRFSINRRLYK